MKTNNLKNVPAVFLLMILAFISPGFSQNGGGFYEDGPLMNRTRIVPFISAADEQTAVVFGGREYGFISGLYTDIYDAEANTFTEVAMNYPHDGEYVVKLFDGRYFVVGGSFDLGVPSYAHTEMFDAETQIFTSMSDMQFGRMQASAAQLTDGRVLVTCAWYDNSAAAAAEIYDIGSNTFSSAGTLITPRASGTLLPTSDGGAVLCSGWPSFGGSFYSSVEYYNPVSNTFESYLDDPIEDDPGWFILPVTKPYNDLRLNDGNFILLGYRPGEVTEYGIIIFNPDTKIFSLVKSFELYSIITDGGFLDIILNKEANLVYLLGLEADSYPWNIGLVTVDLNSGETYYPEELYALDYNEYLYPSTIYLPATGKILLVGISTETASYFYATDKTMLITPEFNSSVSDQSVTYGDMRIAPNPNEGNFNVDLTISEPGIYYIVVTDLNGRVVFNTSFNEGVTGDISRTIQLPGLPSGLYQIAIHGGTQWFTHSIAISNK